MPELAEIFRLHGPEYLAAFSDRMPASHRRAMRDIEGCRTPVFGGSLHACPECPDTTEYSYHSCGNRSCPKCQNGDVSGWIERQSQLLLPTRYFLVTTTLPEECRAVARPNQRAVYDALFRASARAILGLCAEKRHLGGMAGLTGVLQTWRRDMGYHPHIHFIVPAGALSPDGARWTTPKYRDWLIPEKAIAARLKKEFIRLFLQHVLPKGFVKVRHFGFLAARNRKTLLPAIRKILAAKRGDKANNTHPEPPVRAADTYKHEHRCPKCNAVMVLIARIPRHPAGRGPPP